MQRLKPLFLRQMTWTSFTKATMRGRCSSTSKWVTTTERKVTKSLRKQTRMRLPSIIRLSHGYWYLLLQIYLHIYHCQPEETDEDRAAHENLKKSKPSERSVVAMQAKYKVQVQVQAKYKVAENISIFCVDLTKKQLVICDLFDQDLVIWPRTAAEHVQVEQEKAVHHRWHWCNSHGLLHVFSQVIQNLFFLVMNDFLG